MGQMTEWQVGGREEPAPEPRDERTAPPKRNGKPMKLWKKIVLFSVAGVVLLALVIGGIAWSRRGVVAVQTGNVARQDLVSIVTASGEIKPPKENFANVNANSFGKITEILIKEGDQVKKGQLLMKTESVQQEADVIGQEAALKNATADVSAGEAAVQSAAASLRTAQADLQTAQANFTRTKDDFTRAQQLLKDRLIAQQLYDQRRSEFEVAQANVAAGQARVAQAKAQGQQANYNLEMSRAHVAQTRAGLVRATDVRNKTIYNAPLDGIVTSLPVHVGENVVPGIQNAAGSLLYQISNLSIITAEVKVDETDIVNVKIGQTADVLIDALPSKTFKGHVTEIGQSAVSRSTGLASGQSGVSSEEAKDFKVVVTLDEPPPGLRPGLSTTAKITTATRQNALTVPLQAMTVRTRRELEENEESSKGKALAAEKTPEAPGAKDKGKEELQGVFTIRNQRAYFIPIETGIMGMTDIEVTKGLKEKDQIVTGSYQALRTLKNGTKVRIEKAPPSGGPPKPT